MTVRLSGPEPITGVIFDFHATLVDERDPGAWVQAAWRWLGHDTDVRTELGAERFARLRDHLAQVWEHAQAIDPDAERDLSHRAHREVFDRVLGLLPDVEPAWVEALYAVLADQWIAYDDARPVLKTLREAGVRTAVLSNIGLDIRDSLEREGLAEFCDVVVLSYEVGMVKPNPEIFRHTLELLGVPASRALMVGDSWRADGGAAALGVRTMILPRTLGGVHGLDAVLRLVESDGA